MEDQTKKDFSQLLNRHGYGFQYSVIKAARHLFDEGKSPWIFLASEFPVEVRGQGTRIDFILHHRDHQHFYLLAECKRANPALSNWCFSRAPFVYRNKAANSEPVFMEQAESRPDLNGIFAYGKERETAYNPCNIGLEVKANRKGDSQGESGKAIEDACSQVLRGLNGLIENFSNKSILPQGKKAHYLPVIFTTANLFLSDVNLAEAELSSGNVDLTNSKFESQQWLSYQYHLSPGIKHSVSPFTDESDLGKFMKSAYIRTIPIVSPIGIESFLRWAGQLDLFD